LKLAEALAERADCQRRVDELKNRIARCARVQKGEKPAEDPVELLAEADRIFERLLDLVKSINRTNAMTAFEDKSTISDAIAERDITAKKRDLLTRVAEQGSTRQDRYSKSEVRFVSAVPVIDVQKQADLLAKRHRELDTRIQELNWKTEIV
jgi:hypothetical protein